MLPALNKTCLYFASVLLIGTGVFHYFIQPKAALLLPLKRRRLVSLLASTLLLLASGLDVAIILYKLRGSVDLAFFSTYLQNTRHGNAIMLRSFLVLIVCALVFFAHYRMWQRVAFVSSALALLATFSWTSHAAAMGGNTPLLVDLVHFSVASSWAGSLVVLALSTGWTNPQASTDYKTSLLRISRLGLVSVISLFLTGIYTSLIHLSDPESFVRSSYGLSLFSKLALVGIVLAIAFLNRFKHLPTFLKTGKQLDFRRIIRIEAFLLLSVFVSTGFLTTSALPHGTDVSTNIIENAMRLMEFLNP